LWVLVVVLVVVVEVVVVGSGGVGGGLGDTSSIIITMGSCQKKFKVGRQQGKSRSISDRRTAKTERERLAVLITLVYY
jgi:hypothetical protein